MTIHRLFERAALGPEEWAAVIEAYEAALVELDLKTRDDPITHLVARKIIDIFQTGIREPAEITRLAIKSLT